jgi:MYXO-CTERM domain-containing protein
MTSSPVRACRTWLAGIGPLLAAMLMFVTTTAAAEVMQTGGAIIPKQIAGTSCNSNASNCINGNETMEGGVGDIDAIATATISQETFNPLCELTFRVVGRGADYKNTFGWYEVKRDANGMTIAPALNELHVFLGCLDAIGSEKTLTIPKGVSEIGFFLANDKGSCVATVADPLGPTLSKQPSNLFLSQRKFNSDGDGLIHLLVWQSHANPNAFYFGWEDQSGGGDNDFEDLLTYVTGIQCAGGGEPCKAEGEGVCGDGVMQCQDGALTCVPTQMASPEVCNGLNDDCDDETDEGDDLCPQNEICVRGHCEPPCGTGEFRCASNEVCAEGVCIDAACANKDCPSGSVCRAGKCVSPCDDVSCPYGATCRSGVCVDVCEGVTCDSGFVCEPRQSSDGATLVGVCTSCDCRGCDDGQTCSAHQCVDNACKDKTCDAGTHCVAGDCVDNCADATCPKGEICEAGACIHDPNGGGGAGDGGSSASGGDDGGGIVIDPGHNGPGSGGAPNGDGQVDGDKLAIEAKGCGCSVPGSDSSGIAAFVLTALCGALGLKRRRKTR